MASREDRQRIDVLPEDEHQVMLKEAIESPTIWSALMWGGRVAVDLVGATTETDTLRKLRHSSQLGTRVGLNRGNRGEKQEELKGWRLFEDAEFPTSSLRYLDAIHGKFKVAEEDEDLQVHAGHPIDLELFKNPQLLIKLGWRREEGRFQSRIVKSNDGRGVVCSQSYLTVRLRGDGTDRSDDIWATFNSAFATAYLFLTSGRFAAERAQPSPQDFLDVPLADLLPGEKPDTLAAIDRAVARALHLTESERALVKDICDVILPDFKGDETSLGRQRTDRQSSAGNDEPQLKSYCKSLTARLCEIYGEDKALSATILQEQKGRWPLRVVAIHLGTGEPDNSPYIERSDSESLHSQLQGLANTLGYDDWRPKLLAGRTARIFTEIRRGKEVVPSVYFLKPDQIRHWTRTAARHDADAIVGDLWALAH